MAESGWFSGEGARGERLVSGDWRAQGERRVKDFPTDMTLSSVCSAPAFHVHLIVCLFKTYLYFRLEVYKY